MSTSAFLLAVCVSLPAQVATPNAGALTPNIIPAPASLVLGTGDSFDVNRATTLSLDTTNSEVKAIALRLREMLGPPTGFPFAFVSSETRSTNIIALRIARNRPALGDEGYELSVTKDSIRIVAYRPAGLFMAMQTMRQLLPPDIESEIGVARSVWQIPALTIVDKPRFAWRGAALDVARHFFTVKEVERYIDLLAMYKLNVFHLHLSDDQGFRIAINSRPKLTSIGASTQVGGGTGGFYTQQDYREIVRYAGTRFITVVPEIDMPEHFNAALVAYPELGCGPRPPAVFTGETLEGTSLCVDNPAAYALVEDIVREITAMTPGPYFHMGGDEVKTLTTDQFTRFVERVQDIVNGHGKRMIGWEEITQAKLLPGTIAQDWKADSTSLALAPPVKVILSPSRKVYLDQKYADQNELGVRWAALIEVRDSYDWNPGTYLKGVRELDILGVEAPIWTETFRNITALEYFAMPRLPAIAEVAWTPQVARDWARFRLRLAAQAPRWRFLGVNYYQSPQIPW